MKYDKVSRRHFLQGLGGASLSLPFLPSLFSSSKLLAQSMPGRQMNFIGVPSRHGLFQMYGPSSLLMPQTNPVWNGAEHALPSEYCKVDINGRHPLHYRSLQDIASSNGGRVSGLIDSDFTPYLDQMMMISHIDMLYRIYGHHSGQFGDQSTLIINSVRPPRMATLDSVIANYPGFYQSKHLIGRSVGTSLFSNESSYGGSKSFVKAGDTSSGIRQNPNFFSNPVSMWHAFFGAGYELREEKKSIIDLVMEDYRSIKRKLSSEDKVAVDRHLSILSDTKADVEATRAACETTEPLSSTDKREVLRTINSVVTSMIACGRCHSYIMQALRITTGSPEDWHGWAHAAYSSGEDKVKSASDYDLLVNQNRYVLKDICLDLTKKLTAADLMKDTIIYWTQEHNQRGHQTGGLPVILFSGMKDKLNMGQYIDYRNLRMESGTDRSKIRAGYPVNQLWGNVMQALGVPKSYYEPLNKGFYGAEQFKTNSGYGSMDYSHLISNPGNLSVKSSYRGWNNHDLSAKLPLFWKS